MARFLVATQPITGHVLPAIPVIRALVGRGHEVTSPAWGCLVVRSHRSAWDYCPALRCWAGRGTALRFLAPNVVFRQASQALARQCAEIGVAPRRFDGSVLSPNLFLQPTVEAFEYRRSDLPPQVHFIGALLLDPPTGFVASSWWDELATAQRPVVLVTQGTVATALHELVAPTINGLVDDNVLVVAVGVRDPAELGLASLAPNVRVERFIPFTSLLPFVDVYVTNGGFGGVQYALSNGVPIVVGGTTEDKAEVGNRVAHAGAGINLRTSTPTPQQVADAVRTVLHDPRYRASAEVIQAELQRHDAPREAVDLLEQLAETKAPVLR